MTEAVAFVLFTALAAGGFGWLAYNSERCSEACAEVGMVCANAGCGGPIYCKDIQWKRRLEDVKQ